ncbi:hypothetical protein [Lysinibacillus antri]|uniref:Uncharacterized protein n=1 Tax=Lysinibacillus antri TaxID=2498145 RepID=A0A432L8B1_9BACI|nr:hypothetical protein [Lysinibacillus antri]RUL48804.1 hypothetical protein EK386_16340 [Lysinibacillus antri]
MGKVFQMKYRPHGINRYKEFIENDKVGIGWPMIGNLEVQTKSEIKKALQEVYGLKGGQLGNALGAIWCFIDTMKTGNVLLVRNKKKVSIGIIGPYQYLASLDNDHDGFCHQRTIKWIETDELLSNYNEVVQTVVRSPGIVTGSTYTVEDLEITSLYTHK